MTFICDKCKAGAHEQCPGGTWCDCDHRLPKSTRAHVASHPTALARTTRHPSPRLPISRRYTSTRLVISFLCQSLLSGPAPTTHVTSPQVRRLGSRLYNPVRPISTASHLVQPALPFPTIRISAEPHQPRPTRLAAASPPGPLLTSPPPPAPIRRAVSFRPNSPLLDRYTYGCHLRPFRRVSQQDP